MALFRITGAALGAALCTIVFSEHLVADIWVFEPSLTLDQRFDDNYFLIPAGSGSLSATRAVGELGLSREAENYVVKGLARVDALLTTNTDVGDEDLDSNQIFAIDASRRSPRSRYGVRLNYKNDTPSRDIAADLSDEEAIAEDTGLLVTQSLSSNVARKEKTIEPRYEYDITRRLQFDVDAAFTDVEHDLPSAQDAIYQRYLDSFPRNEDGSFDGEPLPYNAVTIDDVGGVFSPTGELDDYREAEVDLGLRFQLTPITTLTASLGYSIFEAQVLPAPEVFFNEFQLDPDDDVRQIVRKPRREQISTTTTVTLGFERFLTPTLQFTIDGGVYTNTSDNTDTFRADDVILEGVPEPVVGKSDSDGWLASTSLTYDAGVTRYSARFAVDVQPSSSGAQVETNELTGEMLRVLSPRLNVSLRGRAFEPDRVGARVEDRFARRFISFEPRIQWKYTRNWTVSAAYRYRRQKARIDPVSAESNAILLAVKYTPPSKVRDAAQANGL